MTMALTKVLHTTSAVSHGGRNGHTKNKDGLVSVDLSVPKDMGGPGKPNTTTPEDLFAAGYSACLGGAIDYMATQMKIRPKSVEVNTTVSIGQDATGFGLQVAHDVVVEGACRGKTPRRSSRRATSSARTRRRSGATSTSR